jgi:hypothetical protein
MRRLLLAIPLLFLLAPFSSGKVALQRYLESLKLGDSLKEIEYVYPPKRNWGSYRDPRGDMRRMLLDRTQAKYFPVDAESLRLGFRGERLSHIQVIYTKEYSRKKPIGDLVVDLSLVYGEPRRIEETYFWWDDDTVIAVSDAMLQAPDGSGTELRTSLELMDYELFEPLN